MGELPLDTITAREWPPHAQPGRVACGPVNADVFDRAATAGSASPTHPAIAAALRICDRCPARTACADWAVDTDQRRGVWGGTTPAERRQILRTRTLPRS